MSLEPTNENCLLFWTSRIFSWVWKIFLAKLCNLSFQTPYHTYEYAHYNLQNKPYEKQNRCKKLPHLKNRITKSRIIATMLPLFSAPQYSKWAAYHSILIGNAPSPRAYFGNFPSTRAKPEGEENFRNTLEDVAVFPINTESISKNVRDRANEIHFSDFTVFPISNRANEILSQGFGSTWFS